MSAVTPLKLPELDPGFKKPWKSNAAGMVNVVSQMALTLQDSTRFGQFTVLDIAVRFGPEKSKFAELEPMSEAVPEIEAAEARSIVLQRTNTTRDAREAILVDFI